MDLRPERSYVFKDIDDVLNYLGGYGRFQILLNITLCMVMISVAPHIFVMYFVALDPPWRCVTNSTVCTLNRTMTRDDKERCSMSRSHWKYTESYDYSIITEYDIYCQHQWVNYFSTSVLFFSWCIGAVICGYVADNYGRRIVVITSFIMIIVSGLCLSFSPDITVFTVIRFIMGFFMHGGTFQLAVGMSECTTGKYRTISVAFITICLPISTFIVGITAYFIKEWRNLLIALSVPYVTFLPMVFLLPESITWLYVHRRKEDLMKILNLVSYWNKKSMPQDFILIYPVEESSEHKTNFLDIFRPGKVLLITSVLGFACLVIMTTNVGLYFAANDLGESLYLNFIFLTLVELPGSHLARLFSDKVGRKPTVTTSMIFASLLCIAISFTPSSGNVKVFRVIFGVISKFLVCIALNGLLLWTLELHPTKCRSQGMGFTLSVSRIGAGGSSWIAKGLRPFYHGLPFLVMGGTMLIGGILLLMLPETRGMIADVPTSEELADIPVTENINARNISPELI